MNLKIIQILKQSKKKWKVVLPLMQGEENIHNNLSPRVFNVKDENEAFENCKNPNSSELKKYFGEQNMIVFQCYTNPHQV
jgi:hypothetical protein